MAGGEQLTEEQIAGTLHGRIERPRRMNYATFAYHFFPRVPCTLRTPLPVQSSRCEAGGLASRCGLPF